MTLWLRVVLAALASITLAPVVGSAAAVPTPLPITTNAAGQQVVTLPSGTQLPVTPGANGTVSTTLPVQANGWLQITTTPGLPTTICKQSFASSAKQCTQRPALVKIGVPLSINVSNQWLSVAIFTGAGIEWGPKAGIQFKGTVASVTATWTPGGFASGAPVYLTATMTDGATAVMAITKGSGTSADDASVCTTPVGGTTQCTLVPVTAGASYTFSARKYPVTVTGTLGGSRTVTVSGSNPVTITANGSGSTSYSVTPTTRSGYVLVSQTSASVCNADGSKCATRAISLPTLLAPFSLSYSTDGTVTGCLYNYPVASSPTVIPKLCSSRTQTLGAITNVTIQLARGAKGAAFSNTGQLYYMDVGVTVTGTQGTAQATFTPMSKQQQAAINSTSLGTLCVTRAGQSTQCTLFPPIVFVGPVRTGLLLSTI